MCIYKFDDKVSNLFCSRAFNTIEWFKFQINIFVEDEASLGLMIRGGREFGLGIYVTGVDRNSVSHRAGLKVSRL